MPASLVVVANGIKERKSEKKVKNKVHNFFVCIKAHQMEIEEKKKIFRMIY